VGLLKVLKTVDGWRKNIMDRKFLTETIIIGIIVICFLVGYYIYNYTDIAGGLLFFAYVVTSPTWMLITFVGIVYWIYLLIKTYKK